MRRVLGLFLLLMPLLACSGDVGTDEGADAGLATTDSGSSGHDASLGTDAGGATDAGSGPDASTCVNSCTPAGKKRCNGVKIDTCKSQANGCLSWVTADCPSGQSCMVMGSAMCM